MLLNFLNPILTFFLFVIGDFEFFIPTDESDDPPEAPGMVTAECHDKYAIISWKPLHDSTIETQYDIEYMASFRESDDWKLCNEYTTTNRYNFSMRPGANYSFRVTAKTTSGNSPPSEPTKNCLSKPDVPDRDPDVIEGEGTRMDNFLISWTPMQPKYHNGPGFHNRIYYRRSVEANFNLVTVPNWKLSSFEIKDVPTYVKFHFKVVAANDLGESRAPPIMQQGYSGEGAPNESPANFELVHVETTHAEFQWNRISLASINGHLRQNMDRRIWTEVSAKRNILNEVHVGALLEILQLFGIFSLAAKISLGFAQEIIRTVVHRVILSSF